MPLPHTAQLGIAQPERALRQYRFRLRVGRVHVRVDQGVAFVVVVIRREEALRFEQGCGRRRIQHVALDAFGRRVGYMRVHGTRPS